MPAQVACPVPQPSVWLISNVYVNETARGRPHRYPKKTATLCDAVQAIGFQYAYVVRNAPLDCSTSCLTRLMTATTNIDEHASQLALES